MKNNNVESKLDKLKDSLPVNDNLKKELRQSFKPGKKSGILKKLTAVAAAAALIFAVTISLNDRFVDKVSAAALKISNYVSIVDTGIGQSSGAAEYKGTIYTSAAGDGLYSYNKTGYHKLYSKEVNSVSVSRDGKKLAMSASGSLLLYDTGSGNTSDLLKADDEFTYYEQPSWSYDGNKVIFTKTVVAPGETHGFAEKEKGIYELELSTKKISKITDGSYASYVYGKDAIVFERDNTITMRSLKNGDESIVDSGRFPSASPDGSYLAYVKTVNSTKDLDINKNAKMQESVADVWIADTTDHGSKKKVTNNYIKESISAEEWLKSISPSETPQVLSVEGAYSYYNPIWTSNANAIYVLKNANGFNGAQASMKLVRIDFTENQMTAENTIKSFIQALILRDDDYAKSLMENPPEILTLSNPRQVGYKILASGKEGNKTYVDADIYWQYTANPYYMAERSRYYLTQSENGYKINEIKKLSSEEVYSKDGKTVYYVKRDEAGTASGQSSTAQEILLFKESDIPSQYLPQGEHRFSNLYYNSDKRAVLFTIQGVGSDSSLNILVYDLESREFKLIDSIKDAAGYFLTTDNSFTYAALDYFHNNNYEKANVNVYNLNDKSKTALDTLFKDTEDDSITFNYWDDSSLIIEIRDGNQVLKYRYYPDESELEILK